MKALLAMMHDKHGVKLSKNKFDEMQAQVEHAKALEIQYQSFVQQRDLDLARLSSEIESLNGQIKTLYAAQEAQEVVIAEGVVKLEAKTAEWRSEVRYGREQHVAAEVHARVGAAVVQRGRSVREQVLERNALLQKQAAKTGRLRTLNVANTTAAAAFAAHSESRFVGLSELTAKFVETSVAQASASTATLRGAAETAATFAAAFPTGHDASVETTGAEIDATGEAQHDVICAQFAAFAARRDGALNDARAECASFSATMLDTSLPALEALAEVTHSAAHACAEEARAAATADSATAADLVTAAQGRCEGFASTLLDALTAERAALDSAFTTERSGAAENAAAIANASVMVPLSAVRALIASHAAEEESRYAALASEFDARVAAEKSQAEAGALALAEQFKTLLLEQARAHGERLDALAAASVSAPLSSRADAVRTHSETLRAQLTDIATDAVAAIDSAAAARSASVSALIEARVFAPSASHAEELSAHRATLASDTTATLAMLSVMTDQREARCAARERSADEEKASLESAAASMREFVEATTSAAGGFLCNVASFSAAMSLSAAAQLEAVSATGSAFSAAVQTQFVAINVAAQKLAVEDVQTESHTSETPSKSTIDLCVQDAPSPFASPARNEAVVGTASAAIDALGSASFNAKIVIGEVMATVATGYVCVTPVSSSAASSSASRASTPRAATSAAETEALVGQILEEHSILEEQIAKIDSSPAAAMATEGASAVTGVAPDVDSAAAAFAAKPPQPPAASKSVGSSDQEEIAPAVRNTRASRRRGGKPVPRPLRKKKSSGLSKTPGRKTPVRGKKDGGVKTRRSRRLATSEMTPNSPREMR